MKKLQHFSRKKKRKSSIKPGSVVHCHQSNAYTTWPPLSSLLDTVFASFIDVTTTVYIICTIASLRLIHHIYYPRPLSSEVYGQIYDESVFSPAEIEGMGERHILGGASAHTKGFGSTPIPLQRKSALKG